MDTNAQYTLVQYTKSAHAHANNQIKRREQMRACARFGISRIQTTRTASTEAHTHTNIQTSPIPLNHPALWNRIHGPDIQTH